MDKMELEKQHSKTLSVTHEKIQEPNKNGSAALQVTWV